TLAVVVAALFSAAHYISQPFPDSAFIALFFFGLAQCWLYAKTDRSWCPMLNHALFNLTNIVLLLVLPQ
ncbi:MAG: CPBP family intramembrane metalloprotease, partial [Kiritimatiellae bacterium]|nr:CPBP family intramembrane metalloprotease [Kiritimatiellia bacterium]